MTLASAALVVLGTVLLVLGAATGSVPLLLACMVVTTSALVPVGIAVRRHRSAHRGSHTGPEPSDRPADGG